MAKASMSDFRADQSVPLVFIDYSSHAKSNRIEVRLFLLIYKVSHHTVLNDKRNDIDQEHEFGKNSDIAPEPLDLLSHVDLRVVHFENYFKISDQWGLVVWSLMV